MTTPAQRRGMIAQGFANLKRQAELRRIERELERNWQARRRDDIDQAEYERQRDALQAEAGKYGVRFVTYAPCRGGLNLMPMAINAPVEGDKHD